MECSVVLDTDLAGRDPDEVYAYLVDFERYPELTTSVVAVAVNRTSAESVTSSWAVRFRRGVLEWTEADRLDPAARRVEFTQTAGDFATFSGSWAVEPLDDGARVTFTSRFDLGVASLASLVDPVAATAMRDGISDILRGLFGADIVIREVEVVPAAAPR